MYRRRCHDVVSQHRHPEGHRHHRHGSASGEAVQGAESVIIKNVEKAAASGLFYIQKTETGGKTNAAKIIPQEGGGRGWR